MNIKSYKKLYLIYKQKYYEQVNAITINQMMYGGSDLTLTTMDEFDEIFEEDIKLKFDRKFNETNFLRYILTRPSLNYGRRSYLYGINSYFYSNYVNNLSDHLILVYVKENILFISLNVEHIVSITNNINNNLRYILNDSTYNIDIIKIRKIINLKNKKIKLCIQHIIDNYSEITKIIVNIQEGYPSIYKELVENLKFIENNGKASKLICQNVYEGFSNVPLSIDPTKNISTTFEPDYFEHTRCNINGCFFTIIFNRGINYNRLTYLDDRTINYRSQIIELDFNNNDYELLLGRHIYREQENCNDLLYTKPTELYISIYTKDKHGVPKGTIMLICKSILIREDDLNILNVHLDPNYLLELKDKIKRNELSMFNEISNEEYRDIYNRLYEIYGVPILELNKVYIIGDFNKNDITNIFKIDEGFQILSTQNLDHLIEFNRTI